MNAKLLSSNDTKENFKQSLEKIKKICLHNPTKGIERVETFYADCKSHIDILQEAEIWLVIGIGHHVGKDYIPSLKFFQKAFQVFEEHAAIERLIGTQNWMALSYKAMENPEKALSLLFNSLQLSQQYGFDLSEYRVYNCLGGVYQSIYNSQKAIEYFEKALLLCPPKERAIALSNLASIYSNISNHKKALTYLKEAYDLRHVLEDLMSCAYITVNIVITLGELLQYDQVLPKLKELNKIAKELKGTAFIHLYQNALVHQKINRW